MQLALKLAAKGNPSPNPYVGAVLVKNGKIIGKGFHKRAGLAHAEVEAINDAGKNAKGATLYVTFEPCNHYGRTPPCTQAITRAGIKRVVFAMKDPNPNVKGRGESELRNHGIGVIKGICGSEARKLNEIFIKYSKTKMPFVVLKIAMSLDGKIATRTGDSKWITGKKARDYAHKLRGKCDAVLVGINTVLKDNPHLDGSGKDTKIILDSGLRVPLTGNIWKKGRIIIAASEKSEKTKREKLEKMGANVLICGKERVDLKVLLKKLGETGITSLFVEGGGEVHGAFLDLKLAHKIILIYAPKIIGGKDAKIAVGGKGIAKMSSAIKPRYLEMKKIGKDFVFEGYTDTD